MLAHLPIFFLAAYFAQSKYSRLIPNLLVALAWAGIYITGILQLGLIPLAVSWIILLPFVLYATLGNSGFIITIVTTLLVVPSVLLLGIFFPPESEVFMPTGYGFTALFFVVLYAFIGLMLVAQETHDLISMTRAASKAEESFLAVMSHEIRNPLNALLGTLKELSKSTELNRSEKESVE